MGVTGALGLAFERIVIRPVYGHHLKQILVTMGGLIVVEQLIYVFFGPRPDPAAVAGEITGSLLIGDAAIQRVCPRWSACWWGSRCSSGCC